ncbi:MAG: cation transporter, partial [Actinomycetota bacterium]
MRTMRDFELPPQKERVRAKAVRFEWITIAYLVSAVVLVYLTLGASQAMKAVWLEDLLSLVPPMAFLIGDRVRRKPPDKEFPFGHHAAISIAYFAAAMALAGLGLFIFYDSFMKFISFEHAPIGVVQPFGEPVWLGWFMLGALLWSAVPAVILGRIKISIARELHDKVLYADAEMNKADWMTAVAGMVGVIGIGLGIWWLDAAAAIFISLDIMKDGFTNVRIAVHDLSDGRPR